MTQIVKLSPNGAKAAGYPNEQAKIICINSDGISATVEILTGGGKAQQRRAAGMATHTGVLLQDCEAIE